MFKDKAFKYVASQDAHNMGSGQKRLQPQKNPTEPPQYMNAGDAQREAQKPRVIVRQNQGDKRVPAAKSRPKKRKAVTPEDESTLSMDCIEWSHLQHDVTSLANLPPHRLPLLVKVVKGYHGNAGQALAIGQVRMTTPVSCCLMCLGHCLGAALESNGQF